MAHVLTHGFFDNDTTCEVTSQELEVVTPSVFQNTLHLPVQATWLQIDRSFASAMSGTVLLMLISVGMVLGSMHVAEAPPTQSKPATASIVPAPTHTEAELSPAPPALTKRTQHTKRKVHKIAAKPVRRNKLAKRPLKLQKRASATR